LKLFGNPNRIIAVNPPCKKIGTTAQIGLIFFGP
jgi:hypothetical protein